MESQINSGWKYKENALVNPEDIFLQGQGRGLALKEDSNMADVERIQAPAIPQSMIELSKILGDEIQQISGVNEELLGSAEDDKAGILSMLRQGAGLTTLQILFDQLDQSQKLLGRIFIDLIQTNFSPGKIQRIIGETPADQFYNKAFGKYDAVVEEGLNTSTQRQMQFKQLLALREIGIPVPTDLLVRSSTLQNKEELVEAIGRQEQQAAQLQQVQAEAALNEQSAKTKDLEARAEANAGLGLERASRVQENRALAIERLSESEKDKELATLHKVKAMKELESMDLSQIEVLLKLTEMMKEIESPSEKQEEMQVQQPNIEELAVATKGELQSAGALQISKENVMAYKQTRHDRIDESRGMKRYYEDREGKRMDSQFAGMIHEDHSAPANLPQHTVHNYYPKCSYMDAYELDDTYRGLDDSREDSVRKIEAYHSDVKY